MATQWPFGEAVVNTTRELALTTKAEPILEKYIRLPFPALHCITAMGNIQDLIH